MAIKPRLFCRYCGAYRPMNEGPTGWLECAVCDRMLNSCDNCDDCERVDALTLKCDTCGARQADSTVP